MDFNINNINNSDQVKNESQLNLDKCDHRLQMALISDRSEFESDLEEPNKILSKQLITQAKEHNPNPKK